MEFTQASAERQRLNLHVADMMGKLAVLEDRLAVTETSIKQLQADTQLALQRCWAD